MTDTPSRAYQLCAELNQAFKKAGIEAHITYEGIYNAEQQALYITTKEGTRVVVFVFSERLPPEADITFLLGIHNLDESVAFVTKAKRINTVLQHFMTFKKTNRKLTRSLPLPRAAYRVLHDTLRKFFTPPPQKRRPTRKKKRATKA